MLGQLESEASPGRNAKFVGRPTHLKKTQGGTLRFELSPPYGARLACRKGSSLAKDDSEGDRSTCVGLRGPYAL